jgi:hypothetical protein
MEAPEVPAAEEAPILHLEATTENKHPEPVDEMKVAEMPNTPAPEDTTPSTLSPTTNIHKADVEQGEETKGTESPEFPVGEDTAISASPALIVENTDSEPRPEEFQADTAVKENNALDLQKLSTQDTEPDYVIIKKDSKTSEVANAAAEVADAATGAGLDRDESAPTITDEEAGRIGLRRMSRTPILEVANTAAEVADADAEADAVIERNQPSTPPVSDDETGRTRRMSEVAAEVADIAKNLDRDQPTPPISDEEAGRIGLRRMSQTPIHEVARTAAEVADVAAILDRDHMVRQDHADLC